MQSPQQPLSFQRKKPVEDRLAKPDQTPAFACPYCDQPLPEPLIQEIRVDMVEIQKHLDELEQKVRMGRPLRPAAEGERAPLGLKVPPKLKARLDEAARSNGRTQSMEAEARLELSFDRVDLLPDVLRMAYGENIAVVLAFLG